MAHLGHALFAPHLDWLSAATDEAATASTSGNCGWPHTAQHRCGTNTQVPAAEHAPKLGGSDPVDEPGPVALVAPAPLTRLSITVPPQKRLKTLSVVMPASHQNLEGTRMKVVGFTFGSTTNIRASRKEHAP